MSLSKGNGIVLSSTVVGEADVMSRVMTREFGKITIIFKGIKKTRSRPLSATEPGSFIALDFYRREGADSGTAREFSTQRFHHQLRKDYNRIIFLSFMLEVVDRTSGFDDQDINLFNLLSSGIVALEETEFPLHLLTFFLIHLLRLHGILPDLERCRSCGVTSFQKFTLAPVDLGLLCGACSPDYDHLMGLSHLTFIRACLVEKFHDIKRELCEDHSVSHLTYYCALFLEHYFNITFRSKTLLFQVMMQQD